MTVATPVPAMAIHSVSSALEQTGNAAGLGRQHPLEQSGDVAETGRERLRPNIDPPHPEHGDDEVGERDRPCARTRGRARPVAGRAADAGRTLECLRHNPDASAVR